MKRKVFHISNCVLHLKSYSKTLLGFGYFYSVKTQTNNNGTNQRIKFCIDVNKIWKGTHKTLTTVSVEAAEVETNS